MTILRVRASTFTPSGDPTWASNANAVDAGDGTYATWTSTVRRGTTTGVFAGFDFSSIPANSPINSVSAELRHYESNITNLPTVTVDGTAVTVATAVRVDAVALAASLPSSVNVVWTRGNTTTSTTAYVDWLDLIVDYTPFPGSEFRAWNGGAWVPGKLKRWDGSAWVPAQVKRWAGTQWVDVL
jgi:hypothetical protein